MVKTENTNINIGGAIITDYQKHRALLKYVKDRLIRGVGFIPIYLSSLEIDEEYYEKKLKTIDIELAKKEEKESKYADDIETAGDRRRGKKIKAAGDPYVACKTDLEAVFKEQLEQIVTNEEFKEYQFNEYNYHNIDKDHFKEVVYIIGSFDGYESVGYYLSNKR
eukprot:358203_1